MKKALAVLMTLTLLLMAIPTLAEEKVAPLNRHLRSEHHS